MLPSSIKALVQKLPAAAEQSFGIAIGRRELAIAAVTARPTLQWTRVLAVPEELFSGGSAASCIGALADTLARAVPEARNRYVPVHVALPDPLGRVGILELESVPQGERLRLQLVRWRLAKEIGLTETELEVGYQDLGGENQKRLLLGQALNLDWLACVKTALARAQITAWSVNQAVCFRFNAFHARFAAAGKSGAMLALDPDAWSMAVWTADMRLRFVRSRWRTPDAAAPAEEIDVIAQEFERGILAYVHGNEGRTVDEVYISAAAMEGDLLAGALNGRLQTPCVPLALDIADVAAAGPRSELADVAVVAALAA